MNQTFLDKIKNRIEETKEELNIPEETSGHEAIVKLSPNEIGNWEYRDRQSFELGDLDELATSIETKGQAQPIVVVRVNDEFIAQNSEKARYVVIAGFRRWLACKSRGLSIDAVIRDLSFEEAVACVMAENEKEQVSDYSKGMFFHKLLETEKVNKVTLYERFGMKRSHFNNFLAFAEVDAEFWQVIGDLSKVSARTASTIKLLIQKGDAYRKALITISEKIRDGAGERTILALVDKELQPVTPKKVVKYDVTRQAFAKGLVLATDSKGFRIECKRFELQKKQELKNRIEALLQDFSEN